MENVKTDQTFDFTRTEEYKLSIQVGLDGFSFSIIDPQKNRLMMLEEYPITISSEFFLERRFKEWSDNHDLLNRNYEEIRLLFSTKKFTIIPGELYSYEKQHEIADLLFEKEKGITDLDNYIPEIKGNLLFRIPEGLHGEFNNKYPGCRLIHPLAILMPAMMEAATKYKHTLMLFFEKSHFSLILFVEGKLQAANSFNFLHPNDVIYYVLSLLKQQKTDLKEITPFLTGNIVLDDQLYTSLKSYFRNMAFFLPAVTFDAETFTDPVHRFITLYESCE